jgi:YebC/PmpR family DNA-binding regulatory protein
MSKIFPKLSRSITLATKAGGPDPESNATLRVAIQNAKAQNLSKENIENAIKRASGHDASEITEVTYEAKGPHGSLFFVECATDNTNRSVGNLKVILGKNGGEIAPSGSLNFMFERKSVIEFPIPKAKDLEELEFELIDAGLEEMVVEDETVTLVGDYTSFSSLTGAVEGMGIEIRTSGLERLPTQPIDLTEAQLEEVQSLIDKIEEDDDVQTVFTNLA